MQSIKLKLIKVKSDRFAFFILFHFIVLFGITNLLYPQDVNHENQKFDEVLSVWNDYKNAWREKDVEKALSYWNTYELKKYQMPDWQLYHFNQAIYFCINFIDSVTQITDHADYVEFDIVWSDKNKKEFTTMKRYFINENGRWVGINAIYLFTKDWEQLETEHFIIHYENDSSRPDQETINKLDHFYNETCNLMGIQFNEKIDYYKCANGLEVGKLLSNPPAAGRAMPYNKAIVSRTMYSPHEIVHVLAMQMRPRGSYQAIISFIEEGLAVSLGGTTFNSPELCVNWAKQLYKSENMIPLDSLIRQLSQYPADKTYPLAGSFVKYLIDQYGMNYFKALYNQSMATQSCMMTLNDIYGKSIPELEEEWKNYLENIEVSKIKIGLSADAKEILMKEDPLGDDYGDGHYTYPDSDFYTPGIADLISFRVLQDSERIYFGLQFAKYLDRNQENKVGLNGIFASIFIHIGEGQYRNVIENGNAVLNDTYQYVIEIGDGILFIEGGEIDHGFWKTVLFQDVNLDGKGKSEFIFSIPKDFINQPAEQCKYAVAVGLQHREEGSFMYNGVGGCLKVGIEATAEQGGGATDPDFSPNIYDILTPDHMDQKTILSSYDSENGQLAIIPMIE